MGHSAKQPSRPRTDAAREAGIAVWLELTGHLERRGRELADEVRGYPTPIARCDEQLTKLIEQRTRAADELQRLLDAGPERDRRWPSALRGLLANSQAATDDETERVLRARLAVAIAPPQHRP